MKRILMIVILTIAAASLALGQTQESQTKDKKAGRPKEMKTADHQKHHSGSVEEALMQLERDAAQASVRGDVAFFERLEADDYTFTDPGGQSFTKAQDMANMKAGDLKFESFNIDDMKVRVYGDTAVVTGMSSVKGAYKGQDISGPYRWLDVFVKRKGQWQLVAGQVTRVAPQ